MDLHDYRENYSAGRLLENEAGADPVALFEQWLATARDCEHIIEPTAMTLATASSEGKPSARMVLLKAVEPPNPMNEGHGLVFFSNYVSRKGQELAANPQAALLFHWPPLERQVRIEGRVEKIALEDSQAYFCSRPKASQLGAAASPQSQAITAEQLHADFAELEQRYAKHDVIPKPEHWGGYRLVPDYYEFWQGCRSRLHDRLVYQRPAGQSHWLRQRVAP